jgi:hypothetical protein
MAACNGWFIYLKVEQAPANSILFYPDKGGLECNKFITRNPHRQFKRPRLN